MASISRDDNGNRTIQFIAVDGKRRSIRLGKCNQHTAEAVQTKVETIVAALNAGVAIDGETAKWLASIGDALHERLAAVGLVPPRASANARLKAFVDAYIVGRADVKTRTRLNLQVCAVRLVEFFGAEKLLRDVKPGDADEFCSWLRSCYAAATAARTIKRAKQFFQAAVRKELLLRSPFAGCKAGHQSNPARSYFVSMEESRKVLDACPDTEWRLLFALSRYGGLRCPSEHLGLTWADVDWERGRFRVRSPKTEHLADGGERLVPIFPELRPYLETAFDAAEPGTVHLINRYRCTNTNLRTRLNRIIRKAGLKPWPRPFHNLRATRQTELAAEFPLHVVCAWIGNKGAVAAEYYLQVTEADFQRASQSGAKSGAVAVQKEVQHGPATARKDSQELPQVQGAYDSSRVIATCRKSLPDNKLPPRGLEPLS